MCSSGVLFSPFYVLPIKTILQGQVLSIHPCKNLRLSAVRKWGTCTRKQKKESWRMHHKNRSLETTNVIKTKWMLVKYPKKRAKWALQLISKWWVRLIIYQLRRVVVGEVVANTL